tara:strand:- start:314 stop:568 length:255 start_codon:yes stop_codon:yes gene_type:complete
MSPKDKKELERLKTLSIRDNVPRDLGVAIQTFMQQAIIVGEYELDHMPSEYMENLLRTLAKYPEHSMLFMEMVEILERDNIIES